MPSNARLRGREGASAVSLPSSTHVDLVAIMRPLVAQVVEEALASRPEPVPERLLTRYEAAEALNVSIRQFDTLRRDPNFPKTRVGNAPRFERALLLQWARDNAKRAG